MSTISFRGFTEPKFVCHSDEKVSYLIQVLTYTFFFYCNMLCARAKIRKPPACCWVFFGNVNIYQAATLDRTGPNNYRQKLTHLLQEILCGDGFQYILLTRLLDLPTQQKLIQHKVGFLKVKNDIQLTHLQNAVTSLIKSINCVSIGECGLRTSTVVTFF